MRRTATSARLQAAVIALASSVSALVWAQGATPVPDAPAGPTRQVTLAVSPERLWSAVREQPLLARDALVDTRAFTARSTATGADAWSVEIDWDEVDGGAVMRLAGRLAHDEGWIADVVRRGQSLPHENKYCRGPNPDWSVPEPSIDAARSCDYGNFSSAIHELEKCGDHETTLRLLAACVRTGHAAGLVRIAQRYETGMGLPQRADRMTHYLALAAASSTPGYARAAKVLYATAVYFGEGVAADRPRGLELMREAAEAGDVDAKLFLREGWHAAWRRADGRLYAVPAGP